MIAESVGAPGGLRVVVVGKGGVGKSTLSAVLSRTLARRGARVVAIDADEQRNLGATLGVDAQTLAGIVPLAQSSEYVAEKTGARPGEGAGGMLRLNPDTRDVVDRLGVDAPDHVRLLVMGGVQRAGGGCLCPENTILSAAIAGMRLREGDVVVMDTHAGVEHFGRALARGFDRALVVVTPTFNAVQVGLETARLARELGVPSIDLVINQSKRANDLERVLEMIEDSGAFAFTSYTVLPFDDDVEASEPSIEAALDGALSRALGNLASQWGAPGVARTALLAGRGA